MRSESAYAVNGALLYYEEAGSGEALVFRHFLLEYGEKIADVPHPKGFFNADQTDPARGARGARRNLAHYFNTLNAREMAKIKAMVKACAAP